MRERNMQACITCACDAFTFDVSLGIVVVHKLVDEKTGKKMTDRKSVLFLREDIYGLASGIEILISCFSFKKRQRE